MLRHRRLAAVASVLLLLLASLLAMGSTSAGSAASAATSRPSTVTDRVALPREATFHHLAPGYALTLTFTLVPSHPKEFSALLAGVNDPTSSEYHHFLTYPEYLERFAPSSVAATSVLGALRAAGAVGITVAPDRSSVLATFTVREAEAFLGVRFVSYGSDGTAPLYTATGSLVLPPALQGRISAIDGLSDTGAHVRAPTLGLTVAARAVSSGSSVLSRATPGAFLYDNTTKSQWYVGSDYTQIYGATSLFPGGSVANGTFPTHVAVATLLASGYNDTSQANLPPWDPAVITTYFNDTFPSSWPKPQLYGVPVTIGGVRPPAPGTFGVLNDSSLDEFENSLDLEMVGSLAPGASVYNFYFAASLLGAQVPDATIAGDFAQSLAAALAYNYTPPNQAPVHLGVVSGSFGLADLNSSAWNRELEAAALLGVTVVISSGDQGNAPDYLSHSQVTPWPTWPGSATFNNSGAISVGGVSLVLSGTPSAYTQPNRWNLSFDANVGAIQSMVAWYNAPAGPGQIVGTEGGISTVYAEPSWQFHSAAQWPIVNATDVQGASSLGRAEPDVAFAANTTIAAVFANATGTVFATLLQGTSVAAPLFAGLLADVIGVASARSSSGWAPLGFLDSEIYRIASYYWAHPGRSGDPFLDVTHGANYVFRAGPGWDAVTGWGGIEAAPFLAALENRTVSGFVYTGATPGLPGPQAAGPAIPWTVIFVIFGVGFSVAVALILIMARPPRRTGPVTIPYGAQAGSGVPVGPGVPGGIYPGATFLCPYCGAVRPAEPVRCPQCGAL